MKILIVTALTFIFTSAFAEEAKVMQPGLKASTAGGKCAADAVKFASALFNTQPSKFYVLQIGNGNGRRSFFEVNIGANGQDFLASYLVVTDLVECDKIQVINLGPVVESNLLLTNETVQFSFD